MEFDPRKAARLVAQLPPREREVLAALGQCLSQKEIAAQMEVSLPTVKFYVKMIFVRLKLRSRSELVRVAVAAKLV